MAQRAANVAGDGVRGDSVQKELKKTILYLKKEDEQ